jgi:hypothetical protein
MPLPGKQFIDHLFSKLREMKCSRCRFIVQGCYLFCNPGGNKQRSLPAVLPALLQAGSRLGTAAGLGITHLHIPVSTGHILVPSPSVSTYDPCLRLETCDACTICRYSCELINLMDARHLSRASVPEHHRAHALSRPVKASRPDIHA